MWNKRGFVVVVSAPSGTGKTTVCDALLKADSRLAYSISCTTRAPREKEVDGKDYFFLSKEKFAAFRDSGELAEWAEVFGRYYGTPKKFLEEKMDQGFDVLLDIDPQGAIQLKTHYPEGIFIFLLPPSWDVLEKRLRVRGTDDRQLIERRLKDAEKELTTVGSYNYVVINDRLEEAVGTISAIIRAERHRLKRLDPANYRRMFKIKNPIPNLTDRASGSNFCSDESEKGVHGYEKEG